jgi:Peptidase family M1 domain
MEKIHFLRSIILAFSLNLIFFGMSFSQKGFRQLNPDFPSPNTFRTASGAPGSSYFQQKVDYKIEVELVERGHSIVGKETITYQNNSPDMLSYLWMQLDQNIMAKDSHSYLINPSELKDSLKKKDLDKIFPPPFDGGFKIHSVREIDGRDISYSIVRTMMRIDLETPLLSGNKFDFEVEWEYKLNETEIMGGRSGYEFFEEDQNAVYTIAQFYPRMAVYNEVEGWENKQYLGQAEFGLEFGDFLVRISVPEDHIVGATGTLINPEDVLTSIQIERFNRANKSDDPVFIVTEEEALKNESKKRKKTKTWVFEAQMVRDFAFASSRKFIWEGMAVEIGEKNVFAHAMYPKEANPLWEKVVTRVVAHTLKVYSKFSIDYPYSHALAVHIKGAGMEYPMICFNGRRPKPDGSYSDYIKSRLIGLIIHEIGHNFFPMIINSNERKWIWMDEGINSFLEFLTEKEWDPEFPSRRGPASTVINYMSMDPSETSPIMSGAENVKNKGMNGYLKPAAALNILREVIMGRENFDFAFKTYANRWKFKHPIPADFFRTLQDASSIDLDWFWRGWFYSTDFVDIGISDVKWYKIRDGQLKIGNRTVEVSQDPNEEINQSSMVDQYHFSDSSLDEKGSIVVGDYYENWKKNWGQKLEDDVNLYQITFSRSGGVIMPVLLSLKFEDGSSEKRFFPAEIWRFDNETFTKTILSNKAVSHFELDPKSQTADINISNNFWPEKRGKLRNEDEEEEESPRPKPNSELIIKEETK